MFEYEESASSEFPKLPTFAQWCKTASVQEAKPIRFVKKVWVPGRFDNFTLETEVFRLRIGPTSGLYSAFRDLLEAFVSRDAALAIEVVDKDEGLYKLKEIESESSFWFPLGDYGFELKVQDKAQKKRAAKNPVQH